MPIFNKLINNYRVAAMFKVLENYKINEKWSLFATHYVAVGKADTTMTNKTQGHLKTVLSDE